jgi:hypothetical protein
MMLLVASKIILFAVSGYFLLLGVISLFRPNMAKRFLLGFANSAPKHYSELCIRLAVGGALLLVAPSAYYPAALNVAGWLLVGTTAVMALVPWHMHDRFTRASVPKALNYLPIIGAASLGLASFLLWSIYTANPA